MERIGEGNEGNLGGDDEKADEKADDDDDDDDGMESDEDLGDEEEDYGELDRATVQRAKAALRFICTNLSLHLHQPSPGYGPEDIDQAKATD